MHLSNNPQQVQASRGFLFASFGEEMTHTAYTAALDANSWDLQLDANGNVVMAKETNAIVQNVCNEGRLFTGDAYFRFEDGIDWFTDQLGEPVQEAVTSENLRTAALAVPGVLSVDSVTINELNQKTRTLHGTIEITTEGGSYGRAEI